MISKMNKLSILIYHKEYEKFLDQLRELGVVHIEMHQGDEVDETLQQFMHQRAGYLQLIKDMQKLADTVADERVAPQQHPVDEVIDQYTSQHDALQALYQKLPLIDKDIAQMENWGDFDWNKLHLLEQSGWKAQFFCCPNRAFEETWVDDYNAIVIQESNGQKYFITLNPQKVDLEAETVRLPEVSLSQLQNQKKDLIQSIEAAKLALARYCAANTQTVEAALENLESDIDLVKVKHMGCAQMADGALVMLEGWVPVENFVEVKALLEKSGVYYQTRAAEKEDNAPIKLKNNKITSFFETLTRMYGMPDYGEFDPTPLLAPFYALFFGLCVGDAGYGLFLVALGFWLKKKMDASMHGLLNLLITLGGATTIVGALMGTFFGVELVGLGLPEWIKSLMVTGKFDGTTYDKTMILALVIGMFHICFAMLVKAICSTVRYGFKNSLSDWGWLLFVGGSVVSATLNYLGVIDQETMMNCLYGIGGVSAIGIYLLNNLHRNVFVNVGAGLWDTYNMATGLMGDLLSYLRLYALGLAGGMLGGVFNTLGLQLKDAMGDFLFGIPGWIAFGLIFVGGHALNIALSCLSGYVHSIRLTFVEYFKNSGYDGRGVDYKPFSSKKRK